METRCRPDPLEEETTQDRDNRVYRSDVDAYSEEQHDCGELLHIYRSPHERLPYPANLKARHAGLTRNLGDSFEAITEVRP